MSSITNTRPVAESKSYESSIDEYFDLKFVSPNYVYNLTTYILGNRKCSGHGTVCGSLQECLNSRKIASVVWVQGFEIKVKGF